MNDLHYSAAPEETIYIDLPATDALRIKAIRRGSFDMPVVILVHGLPGDGNNALQYLGAKYLYEQGFASLRLFLYDEAPQTRDLVDCTLAEHAADFDAVVQYLQGKGVKKVFGVGHSYGGPTILRSTAQLDGAVLWDPTHGEVFHSQAAKDWEKEARLQKADGLRLYLNGKGYIESDVTYEEQQTMGDTSALAIAKPYPIEVITAGKGILAEFGAKYTVPGAGPRKHVTIAEADHPFRVSDEVLFQLFEETSSFLGELT